MPAASLHDEGWRQGSLIRAPLNVHFLDADSDAIKEKSERFELWMLVTQDCDLAQTRATNARRQFELRPVFAQDENDKLDGLRSRSIAVREGLVLRADGPKLTLTARALNTLKDKREDDVLPVDRRAQIKAWLGLRYDRSAVPIEFESLSNRLKSVYIEHIPEDFRGAIRDVWVDFENTKEIRLFVILADDSEHHRDAVSGWVDGVADDLFDTDDVSVLRRDIETSEGTPLRMLQTYFSLGSAELSNES